MENTPKTEVVETEKQPTKVGTIKAGTQELDVLKYPFLRGRGAALGNYMFAPDLDKVEWQNIVDLIGKDNALEWLRKSFRLTCIAVTNDTLEQAEFDSIDQDPTAVLELWKTNLKDSSAAGETMSQLEDRQKALMTEYMAAGKELAANSTNPVLMAKSLGIFQALTDKLAKLGQLIEKRSRPRKVKVEAATTEQAPA